MDIKENIARWLRTYKLDEVEVEDPTEDGITPWERCSTQTYWLKDADRILNLLEEEVLDKLTVIGDEEIYRLNKADTKERRHIFWEAGFLDGSRANAQFQFSHTIRQIKQLLGVEGEG